MSTLRPTAPIPVETVDALANVLFEGRLLCRDFDQQAAVLERRLDEIRRQIAQSRAKVA